MPVTLPLFSSGRPLDDDLPLYRCFTAVTLPPSSLAITRRGVGRGSIRVVRRSAQRDARLSRRSANFLKTPPKIAQLSAAPNRFLCRLVLRWQQMSDAIEGQLTAPPL